MAICCAASPQLIIDGILKALDILETKNKEIEKPFRLFGTIETVANKLSRYKMAQKVKHDED